MALLLQFCDALLQAPNFVVAVVGDFGDKPDEGSILRAVAAQANYAHLQAIRMASKEEVRFRPSYWLTAAWRRSRPTCETLIAALAMKFEYREAVSGPEKYNDRSKQQPNVLSTHLPLNLFATWRRGYNKMRERGCSRAALCRDRIAEYVPCATLFGFTGFT